MLKVGVTGGIGSGKSLFCKILKSLGYPVYDSDEKAKTIVNDDPELRLKIKNLLGSDSYNQSGFYDRQWVAKKVFNDPKLLQELNSIIHPAVGVDFENWISKHSKSPLLFKETALLIETGIYKKMDFNINISSPIELRIERIQKRDPHRNLEMIFQIISKQMSDE
ncbi:MAG: dephospho-CoA kinase, partial [Cytophagales bacterium]